jgi:hypothetical protein
LSQPLTIITGYVKLLQDIRKEDEIPDRYLSNIMLQIHKIEELKEKIASMKRKLAVPADVSHGGRERFSPHPGASSMQY